MPRIEEVEVSKIRPPEFLVETVRIDLEEVKKSLKQRGEPYYLLYVREDDDGYRLIHGLTLFEAAKLAGLKKVKAVVYGEGELSEKEYLLMMLAAAHNSCVFEHLRLIERLMDMGLSVEEIGLKSGKGLRWVKDRLRLRRLHPEVLEAYRKRRLDELSVLEIARAHSYQVQLILLDGALELGWGPAKIKIVRTQLEPEYDPQLTKMFRGLDENQRIQRAREEMLRRIFEDEKEKYVFSRKLRKVVWKPDPEKLWEKHAEVIGDTVYIYDPYDDYIEAVHSLYHELIEHDYMHILNKLPELIQPVVDSLNEKLNSVIDRLTGGMENEDRELLKKLARTEIKQQLEAGKAEIRGIIEAATEAKVSRILPLRRARRDARAGD